MVVSPRKGEGVEGSGGTQGEEIVRETHSVDRHKDVGHDATTPINDATFESFEFQRIGETHRVGIGQLVMVVAVLQLFVVVIGAVVLRFLNATARGSVVTGCGETYLSSVVYLEHPLYQTLTEGTATDKDATIPVLDGS